MRFQKILFLAGGAALIVLSHRAYGWPGLAAVSAGLMMWVLLHFTRLMTVLKRASNRPIGFVNSAVMLNAKLKSGVTLMHVIAMTRSLGALQSPEGEQPERYRWTDASESHVTAEFKDGKLVGWSLYRPAPEAEADVPPAP